MATRKNKKAVRGSVVGAISGLYGNAGNSKLNNWRNTVSGGAINKATSKNSAVNGALAGALGGAVGGALNYGNSGGNSGGGYTRVEMPVDVGALPTFNSSYLGRLNALARQLTSMNYEDWTKGSQYQSLADRYGNNGRMSMQDVLGQVAARTGGLASSYATTAAQQQYNQYMAQLEEVARQMYSQERGDIMATANLYRNLANDEYGRYRDSLADYNDRLAAAQSAARSAYSGSTYSGGESSIQRLKSQSAARKATGGSSYRDSAAYEKAVAYANAGAQARRTANLLNGYVKNGEITAAEATKIMNELY